MTSPYLSNRTETLESTTPVAPQQARAAQIPLQSFTLPVFPPEAFTSSTSNGNSSGSLDALILTADIKMDEYSDILTKAFEIPDLPASIRSLTLELFALGYPAGFLVTLGERLRNALLSLTVFEQLFGGTVPGTKDDAVAFLRSQRELCEVHFLDTFAPKGFWGDVAAAMSESLRFLELGVTYRHADPEFEGTLPRGEELAGFVKPGMLGLRFAMGSPAIIADADADADEPGGTEVGIKPVGKADRGGREVIKSLVQRGGALVMCDVTMFEVSASEMGKVLDACARLKAAAFAVEVESGWDGLFDGLAGGDKGKERVVEMLELVAVPGEAWVESFKAGGETGLQAQLLEKLTAKWRDLKSVKISVLRTSGEEWFRDGESWARK